MAESDLLILPRKIYTRDAYRENKFCEFLKFPSTVKITSMKFAHFDSFVPQKLVTAKICHLRVNPTKVSLYQVKLFYAHEEEYYFF